MNNLFKSTGVWAVLAVIALVAVASFTILRSWRENSKQSEERDWSEQDLERVIEDWIIESGPPGVVVGISLPNGEELVIAKGRANIADGIALKNEDQFRIGSITKTFIAAEILRLAAADKIDLDAPLNVYLPETPHGDVVTIRYLLSHRSGYFDPVHDDPNFIPYLAENLDKQWNWDDMLAITFQHDLFFEPGTAYSYSNTNYLLLSLVIEKITQRLLGEVLTSDLLTPLNLHNTFYATPSTDTETSNLIRGYTTHPLTGETVDTTTIPYKTIISVSSDTMISNASDLLKWSRLLYSKESVALETSFKEQMLTFDVISPYGLGVFQSETPIGLSFGHGGDMAGYLSLMEYLPEQDLSIVILANSDAPSINLSELRDSILAVIFDVFTDEGVEKWIADLDSADLATRRNAIRALGQSHTDDDRAISSLIEILKSDLNTEIRQEAALALGLVGKGSDEARQALTNALQDEDQSVREAADVALSVLK